MKTWIILGMTFFLIASSGCQPERPRADYKLPVAQLEQSYGRLEGVDGGSVSMLTVQFG